MVYELSFQKADSLYSARISSYALEQQLYARQIPFQHAWGKDSTGAAVGAISRLEYPICLIRLVDLMPGLASVSHSIIAAVMVSNDTQTCFKVRSAEIYLQSQRAH